jgi:ferric-dicitrate binding protein FerR (iron transport regulator)
MNKLDTYILRKVLRGKANKEEQEWFEVWLNASEKHRNYFEELKRYSQKDIEELDVCLVESKLDLFESRLQQKGRIVKLQTFMRYAAVIVLPLAVAAVLWYVTSADMNGKLAQYSVEESEELYEKTILSSSSGNAYELEHGAKDSIHTDGVQLAKNIKEGLSYKQKKQQAEKISYHTLRTAKGDDCKITLSDGTEVYLNCKSELIYPVEFGEGERRVRLRGEAFFDVKKIGQSFIVEMDKMNVQVLGTRFNVKAYTDEDRVQTTLVSGKVKVALQDGFTKQSLVLNPGEQAEWNKPTGKLNGKVVDTDLYTSWIDGHFRFEDARLEDVMRDIARWYDVKLFYQNQGVKEIRFSGRLHRYENIEVICAMLEKISGVSVEQKNNTILISSTE